MSVKEKTSPTGEARTLITRVNQEEVTILSIERVALAEAENSTRVATARVTGVMLETKSKVKPKLPPLTSLLLNKLVKKVSKRLKLLKLLKLKLNLQ